MVPDIIFQTLQPPHNTQSRKEDREREIYPEVCTALFFYWRKVTPRILYAIFPFNSLAKTQFTWSPLAAGKAGKVPAMINCYNGR